MTFIDTAAATQYLTLTVGEEVFALEIGKVREVFDYSTITKVPRMPDFMLGVINLRGNVVPVVDMRRKLGMPAGERTKDTCIVIVELILDGEPTQMGALADSVREVVNLTPDQIAPPPRLGSRLPTEFIKGMGRQDDKFMIILDIDLILSSDELAFIKAGSESTQGATPWLSGSGSVSESYSQEQTSLSL